MNLSKTENSTAQNHSFSYIIQNILSSSSFPKFDIFLIHKLSEDEKTPESPELTEELRHDAFLQFRRKTNNQEFASLPTIKRWFGINGYAMPKREQIYQICFALSLSGKEAEEFLTLGIHEPGVQYNDYHEIIYLYGLENRLTWNNTKKMIEEFEMSLDAATKFSQTHSTNQLMEQFSLKKGETTEQFMQWMLSNAGSFKGYSQTALDYFNTYHSIIIKYIQADAADRLDSLLKESDFAFWMRNKKILTAKNQNEMIQKYIRYAQKRHNSNVSEDLLNNIRELNKIANAKSDSNQSVLTEIFSVSSRGSVLGNLTGKHLSDLLNLPLQMERAIRADKALAELDGLPEDSVCPSWIQDFITDYTKGKQIPQTKTEARNWLIHFCAEHKRRCRLIQRKDILPMILYVAQRQYTDSQPDDNSEYQMDDAKTLFINMANATLSACGMAALNPAFELDAILLACYQPEEMYSYAELADILTEE